MKYQKIIVAFIILCLVVSGCQGRGKTPASNDWSVQVLQWELAENIHSTRAVLQYGGGADYVDTLAKPQEGFQFLLVELSIIKDGSGHERFSWDETYIGDGEGKKYYRHENDNFLAENGIPRIPSTDLTFGSHEGFICFEVPDDVVSPLTLFYLRGEAEYKIVLESHLK